MSCVDLTDTILASGLAENGPDSVAASTKTDSVATEEEDEGKGKGEEMEIGRSRAMDDGETDLVV